MASVQRPQSIHQSAAPHVYRGLTGRVRDVLELSLIHISEPTRPY